MPIVTSTHTQDPHEQAGGGRYVIERHVDDAGVVYEIGPYIASPDFDVAAAVAAHAADLNERLAAAEALAWIGG